MLIHLFDLPVEENIDNVNYVFFFLCSVVD